MADAESAKWYVVHTYSGYENKVKADIEKTIENRKLQDQILEVSVPVEESIEVKNGVQKAVTRKLFPGYVLLNMIMNDATWYVVRNPSKQTITIDVEIFGRATSVEIAFADIKKL